MTNEADPVAQVSPLKPRRFDVETFDILADTTLTPDERDAKLEALMGDVTAEADRLHPNI